MGTVRRSCGGFTLIEMVVTAGIVGLLSVAIVSVFISTVQGSKTARAQANVKSQGDYAITSMERMIRNAVNLPTCTPDYHSIEFTYLDESGVSVTQGYQYVNNAIIMNRGGEPQGSVIAAGEAANAILVTDAHFTCNQGTGLSPGFVTIQFTLVSQGDTRQQTTQQFQARVAMRNIN